MKRIIVFLVSLFSVVVSAQKTLNEGFENWPLSGWQILELGSGTRGWINTFEGITHSGTGSAYSNIDNNHCNNWLVSPAINVVNPNYQLKFWEFNSSIGYYEKATVLISTGSNNPTSGDFQQIFESAKNTDVWEQRSIDLSAYNGQTIYLAFRYEGTWHKWYVDDVSVAPSSFTDGALTQFVNPVGVSENPVTQPINIRIQNLGTTVINDFDINWEVNSVAQPTFSQVSLNLQPGESTVVTLGNYNFASEGSYDINTNLVLANDFESSNNQIQNTFEISSFKDGGIIGITPEGMLPVSGNLDVKATIKNYGANTIDVANITWSVDGFDQTTYLSTNLNLAPNETRMITLGQYTFTSVLHEITATLNALGDNNSSNDRYQAKVAINTFWESFEGTTFPPEGWSINFGTRDGVNFGDPVDGEYYYVSNVDNNYFGVISDTILTPMLNIKTGDHFRFYIKTTPAQPSNHKLVWKNGTTGEINFIQDIANSPGFNTWELRDIDISAAAGNNYIGIIETSKGSYGEARYDLFTSDAKLHQFDNDLKILNGDIYFLAKQNVSQVFECKIRNAGALPVLASEYSIKLMEAPNTELASVNGVDLNSWEDATISLNYTFTDISENRLYFKLEYAIDENISNNTFREANVSVVPNTAEIDTIGNQENSNILNLPFSPNGNTQSLGEDDLSQLLFYPNEFNSPGYVYGIAYKYNNYLQADKVVHYPLQVWISQTSDENLDGGWLPNEQLTLVFDGVIEILPGYNRDLYIPFNQPVLINGLENVVIKNYQYDPEWPPSVFRFFGTNSNGGPTRSISILDVYDLDPNDTSLGFFAGSNITYTRFVVDPSNLTSVLSGVVYNNVTSMPIANAKISIEGSEISVQTDSNGNYSLPSLPNGNYNITVSYVGFADQTTPVNLSSPIQTQDFYLNPLNEVQVTGTVFGNNDIFTPLEQVQVSILKNNVVVKSVLTNGNGDFIFPLVYGGSDYEVKVFMYGYNEEIIPISPDATNIDLGEIILDQEFISPFDVSVVAGAKPTINWKSPKLSKKVKLQKDKNHISTSLTNSPNENVWLGNFFTIASMTTLTSVEIRTDIYQNATDFVSIDIFDLESKELLASSEPFLIYKDSVQTIDIPNIVVDKTILAMVHWQNNASSTNSLAVDYSDPNIANGAMIMYPDGDPQLLSVVFGQGAPKMSFLLRVNTLDDGNPITNTEAITYNVYRGLASDFPNVSNWDKINISQVSNVSFIDNNKNGFNPLEYYRYAVEAIYNNGYSEVTYSNSISGNVLSSSNVEFIESQISVYPVPTSDKITIKFGANLHINKPIEIFNMLGQKVFFIEPSKIENGYAIANVNSLQSGIYFIKIEIDSVIINKKFIVK